MTIDEINEIRQAAKTFVTKYPELVRSRSKLGRYGVITRDGGLYIDWARTQTRSFCMRDVITLYVHYRDWPCGRRLLYSVEYAFRFEFNYLTQEEAVQKILHLMKDD